MQMLIDLGDLHVTICAFESRSQKHENIYHDCNLIHIEMNERAAARPFDLRTLSDPQLLVLQL